VITLSARHAGVTLGLAGLLLSCATRAPGGAGPAADAAVHGTGWSIVPSPNPSRSAGNTLVQVSAGSATNAWAVGYSGGVGSFRTMIQRWNGSRWTVTRSPSPSSADNVLFGVDTLSRTDAWAVGYDLHVTPTALYHQALTEHWNGHTWRAVPAVHAGTQDNDLFGVTALSPTNVWAVGNENIGHFRFRPLVEHWTGAAWHLVPVPSPPLAGFGAGLGGVAAISPRDIWAVGNYDTGTGTGTGTRFQPLIEHWNGARWSLVPAPTAGSAQLSQVSMLTPSDGWAVGSRGAAPHIQALIEHWDGHRWTAAASPVIKGSSLNGVLALSPHLAWAVGSYSPRSGVNRTLIEQWNGRAWTVTPSPNNSRSSELLGIAGTQQQLWAVGDSLTSSLILRH